MRRFPVAFIVAVSCVMVSSAQQRPKPTRSLVEMVKEHGDVENFVILEYGSCSVGDLVRTSEVTFRGMVVSATPRLAVDARSVETDYGVSVSDVTTSSDGELIGRTIVLSRPGGTLALQGGRVTTIEKDFPPFSIGDEVILFASRSDGAGKYMLPCGAQGAFVVRGETVSQASRLFGSWNSENPGTRVGVLWAQQRELRP